MLQEDWIKTIVGFATSTLGFLVALLINSFVELRRDKKAHGAMLKAIKAEASNNKAILDESFLRYYRDGIVVRGFFLGTVTQGLASSLFIKNATPSEIELLNTYLRNLQLANGYRDKSERFWLDAKRPESRDWLDSLIGTWDDNLRQCQHSIDQVAALTES